MAKIKGIELKEVKDIINNEFTGIKANVYLESEKVGYILKDTLNNEVELSIASNVMKDVYKAAEDGHKLIYVSWGKDKIPEFFNYLFQLYFEEELFKLKKKQGYEALIYLDYYPRREDGVIDGENNLGFAKSPQCIPIQKDTNIEKIIKKNQPSFYRIYKELEDFIIE